LSKLLLAKERSWNITKRKTMKKQIIIATLSVALLSVAAMAFADTMGTTTPTTSTKTQTRKECVVAAISVRNAALQKARDTFKIAQAGALKTRKDALTTAKSLPNKTAIRAAVKAANDAYKTSVKQNRDTLNADITAARDTYKATVTACPKV